jgi:hypothetical protein
MAVRSSSDAHPSSQQSAVMRTQMRVEEWDNYNTSDLVLASKQTMILKTRTIATTVSSICF